MKTIHATKGNTEAVLNIKEVYEKAIDACGDWYSEEELVSLRALVASVPETGTLIHGDYHPNNIMVGNCETRFASSQS